MTQQATRDLMFTEEIREMVAESYRGIDAGAGREVIDRLYESAVLGEIPEEAASWALGVGDPVRHADLAPGEVVLDVGCGGGIDTVLAARRVGSAGKVIGLDLLPQMCERTHRAAQAAGVAGWCEVLPGAMEAIPLPDASVDVVISNGVINLSPRKSRTLAEIARVLRPGGRLCIADLLVDDDLPPDVLASEAAWAGCIAGAVSQQVLTKKLGRAGFIDVTFGEPEPFSLDDAARYPLFTGELVDLMRTLIPAERQERIATAVIVRAAKPTEAVGHEQPAEQSATGTTRLEDIPPTEVKAPGVTVRNLKQVDDIELKVMDVAPGCATPFHTHVHAHEGVIVSGLGALRLKGRREPLQPGDVFSVAPNEQHAIECAGDQPFRIVCMDCFVE